jgi:SPP1 gp7 family putative phage head morphogenesis protein
MYQESLRKAANLWWTQTVQYGISTVDEATLKGFKDMGVKDVRWIAADDEKTCPECGARDNQIYKIDKIPPKPHYGCRCYIVPVKPKE